MSRETTKRSRDSSSGYADAPSAKRARLSSNKPPTLEHDLGQTVSFPIFDYNFRSELAQQIGLFIKDNVLPGVNMEIEGKLGVMRLFDGSESQMNLRGITSRILDGRFKSRNPYKFDSGVEVEHFKHLNAIFNGWCSNGNPRSRNRELPDKVKIPTIAYRRVLFIDKIYHDRTRVSLNGETLAVEECVQKQSRAKLDIHTPDDAFDIRISAATENEAPIPSDGFVKTVRAKDRLSYQYGIFSMDITSIHCYQEPDDVDALCEEISNTIRENLEIKRSKARRPPVAYPPGSERSSEVELEIRKMGHLSFLKDVDARQDLLSVASTFISNLEILSRVLREMSVPLACRVPKPRRK